MAEATIDGRYEIRQKLGQGAMGVVYKVHDPQTKRTLASRFQPGRVGRDGTSRTSGSSMPSAASSIPIVRSDLNQNATMEYVEAPWPRRGQDFPPSSTSPWRSAGRFATSTPRAWSTGT